MLVTNSSEMEQECGWARDVAAGLIRFDITSARIRAYPSPWTGSMKIAATSFGATC